MAAVLCRCGKTPTICCSSTYSNLGRRCFGCEYYDVSSGCNYFLWYDPPICDRAKNAIPILLRNVKKVEGELEKARRDVKKMKRALVVSLVIFLVYWLLN